MAIVLFLLEPTSRVSRESDHEGDEILKFHLR